MLLTSLIVLFFAALVTAGFAQPVSFPDFNLESAIREELNEPSGILTVQILDRLWFLDAVRKDITSIEGLEKATNLVELHLDFNSIGSVFFPTTLKDLQVGTLRGNGLTNLTVGALPALINLDLSENELSNSQFMASMPKLISVSMSANGLRSFDLPVPLAHLTQIDLSFNHVMQFSFLSNAPELLTLNLDGNGITNMPPTFAPPKISSLSLIGNRISDLSFLGQLPTLKELDLASNFSRQFVFPQGLKNLRWMNLGENRLTLVTFSPDMTNLSALYMDDNQLTVLPDLTPLSSLSILDVGINKLTEVIIPRALTNLTKLTLDFNPLQRLILPELLATNALTNAVITALNAGAAVYAYPLAPRFSAVSIDSGNDLSFVLTGPPGAYEISQSNDLVNWKASSALMNMFGSVTNRFSGVVSSSPSFYRVRLR